MPNAFQNENSRLPALISAQEMYKRSKNEFMASMCEEQQRLVKYQQQWSLQFHIPLSDLSLRDTIKTLLSHGQSKYAEKLKNEFKISEKM